MITSSSPNDNVFVGLRIRIHFRHTGSSQAQQSQTRNFQPPADATETSTETIFKIISNPKITAKEIASVCGITEDGVAYHIKKLKQGGRIIRIGGSRNGGEWKVVE